MRVLFLLLSLLLMAQLTHANPYWDVHKVPKDSLNWSLPLICKNPGHKILPF